MENTQNKNRILISLGDPAGIGIEVVLKALCSNKLPKEMQPVLVGCKKNLELIYSKLIDQGVTSLRNPRDLEVENLPIEEAISAGKPTTKGGNASFHWLAHATNLVIRNKERALVTAPISKHFWHKAGHFYPGQTECIAALAGDYQPSMLFTAVSPKNGWRLNTLLATTHIPLADVPKRLTPDLIQFKLNTLLTFCKRFKKQPRLAIAGLNPHAGEEGAIGVEEKEWLVPLLNQWKANHPEIYLDGPLPPDTCWLSAVNAWNSVPNQKSPDGILALYHDQGLIPMKLIAFDEAVNTTLGLPFIRTSPDHGTAFDIAGEGVADAKSMIAALKTSWELTERDS